MSLALLRLLGPTLAVTVVTVATTVVTFGSLPAARADLGSLGALTVGLAPSAGFQIESRSCQVAEQDRTFPGTDSCLLFAGGLDASFLWRGRIGATLGVWSVAGQAATAQRVPGDNTDPPAFPDRVSVPLLLDVRPLGFLVAEGDTSYRARFLHGIRLGLGPSIELVRISSDSSIDWGRRNKNPTRSVLGMHAAIDGEIPLHAAAPSGLSLRISLRLLYTPIVTFLTPTGALVSSAPINLASDDENAANTFHGLTLSSQLFLGLVYYF